MPWPSDRSCSSTPQDKALLLGGRRILVVEDEFLLALTLASLLVAAGARVVGPAHTLAEGLRLAEEPGLDAAVLDIHLGRSTSLPVADCLARRGIPFLFQTSDPTFPRGVHAAAPLLSKPFPTAELVAKICGLWLRPPGRTESV